MDKKELNTIISNALAPEWYNNLPLELNFSVISISEKLESFSNIYNYFRKQKEGWDNYENTPISLDASIKFFNNILNSLEPFITNASVWDEVQLKSHWNIIIRNLTPTHTQNIFTYDCPETEFLLKLNLEQPDYVQAAYNFLLAYSKNQNISISNAKMFTAYLLAYEFIQKDYTKITERRNAEKASLTRLRNDFSKYVNQSEQQLNNFLNEVKQKSEEYAKSINETKKTKETNFDNWYNEAKEQHNVFVNETKKHREDLEKTYKELLKLKSPAEYWRTRAIKLKRDGKQYLAWLVALVVFAAGFLYFLLSTISNGTIENIFKETGTAIKWSIVFISFLSLLAYGIRILAKISFSSFHLARDAEEREQLTYLYLALRKDGNVDEKDRQIVLQSLFSRADTGLLKDDASPTMPGSATNIIEKFMMK